MLFCSISSNANDAPIKHHYQFASIEYLFEQEVGRLVLPQIYLTLGITVDISPLPGNRAQYVVNSGEFDGEIMRIWSYGEENPDTVRVPTPYYYLETMAFVRSDSLIKVNSVSDLASLRIGRVRGVKHTNNITEGLTDIYDVHSTQLMFELLEQDRIDVALTNTLDGNVIIQSYPFTNIKAMEKPLATLPLYHYLHKKNLPLVSLLDEKIHELSASGELKSMITQAENYVIKQYMNTNKH
ncbi:hypothetical protein PULV_a2791 [Pseudoalteromonas ulvae UL12]|uniref:substrate-binding periplasmic protein n=1 Tax=Pseudoalteromonas ulvae TaxID=107327 RepID=UPI00186BA0B4|nr:transporter substrate-binding domain-containing protein [Pseudoalteromonas ulvae]MBE0364452.1 hypothetical protein [Pseudoalteromonas ulvae UL12]